VASFKKNFDASREKSLTAVKKMISINQHSEVLILYEKPNRAWIEFLDKDSKNIGLAHKICTNSIKERTNFIYLDNTLVDPSDHIPGLCDFLKKRDSACKLYEKYSIQYSKWGNNMIDVMQWEIYDHMTKLSENLNYPGKEVFKQAMMKALDFLDYSTIEVSNLYKHFGTEINCMIATLSAMSCDPSDHEKQKNLARFIKDKSLILDYFLDCENNGNTPVNLNMREIDEKRKTALECFNSIRTTE
jgi:hypothetical protein